MGASEQDLRDATSFLRDDTSSHQFSKKEFDALQEFLEEFIAEENQSRVKKKINYSLTDLYMLAYRAITDKKLLAVVKLEKIDIWIAELIKRVPSSELSSVKIFEISQFMTARLSRVSQVLIENANDINGLIEDLGKQQHGYTLLMLAIEMDLHGCIPILLNKTKDINAISYYGCTALSNSMDSKNKALTKLLLLRSDVELKGSYLGTYLFDMLRKPENQDLFNLAVEKLRNEFNATSYNWQEPLYFPIGLLNPAQQTVLKGKLMEKVNTMPIFANNTELKIKFIKFLNDKDELDLPRINRLAIAFECISYLQHPEWIKQGDSNLCGVATLMQHLAMNNQEMFVYTVLEVAELNRRKATHLPKLIKEIPDATKKTAFSLADLWMETVKNSYNVITGYHPHSFFETFYGQTTPYQLDRMFQDFGYKVETEAMQVPFATKNMMGKVFDQFRRHVAAPYISMPKRFKHFKLYSEEHHQEKQNNYERFEILKKWFEDNPKGLLPVLLSANLIHNHLFKFEDEKSPIFYVLVEEHYANIKDFDYDPNGEKVKFNLLTYGKSYPMEMDAKVFMKEFLGCLILSSKHQLENRPSI